MFAARVPSIPGIKTLNPGEIRPVQTNKILYFTFDDHVRGARLVRLCRRP